VKGLKAKEQADLMEGYSTRSDQPLHFEVWAKVSSTKFTLTCRMKSHKKQHHKRRSMNYEMH